MDRADFNARGLMYTVPIALSELIALIFNTSRAEP